MQTGPSPISLTYPELQARFLTWAKEQPQIVAVILVGSRARQQRPPDKLSDLDLVVFATQIEPFISSPIWLSQLGEVLVPYLDPGLRFPEWLVIYAGGLKLDVMFVPVESMPSHPVVPGLLAAFPFQDVLNRGMRVLLDKTNPGNALQQMDMLALSVEMPSSQGFLNCVYGFWVSAVRAKKLIERNDLWRAAQAINCDLKERLLAMLEWHTHIKHPERDTWHNGRYLYEWADPRALQALPETFSRLKQAELLRALRALFRLFNWLAAETAGGLEAEYPLAAQEKIASLVDE